MKRKFLLLFLMCILMGGVNSLFAQETTITIGTYKNTSQYFPARLRQNAVGNSYNYSSISQQIYTADEIKTANGGSTPTGKISKLAFKSTITNTKFDKTVKVYMRNIGATSTITAWDTSDELKNNKVYEGTVNIDENGYLVFNLNPAFVYKEGNNILICVDNDRGSSGTVISDVKFDITSTTSKQGAYVASGTNSYGFDAENWPTFGSTTGKTQKNVIEITFSTGGAAVTPKFNNTQAYPLSDMPVTSNPNLRFYVENATHYQVTLSANEDLSDALYQTTDWVTTNGEKEIIIKKDFGLTYTPATKYYWKVVARNGEGDDAPTAEAVYNFSTIAIPGEVTNVYPENGATDITNFITLTWDFAPNTEQYQVNIGSYTSDWFSTNGAEKGSFNVSEYIELEAGKTYTWSVNVKNTAGSPETITEYTFTTSSIYSVTDYTIKVAKADAGKNNVTLEWQYPDATTTQYRINFATTNEVVAQGEWSDRIASTEMGSYTMENVDYSETYYFRVDVRNENATANGDIVYCLVFDENKDWQATKYNNANDVYIRAGIYIPVEKVDENTTIARAKNVTIESDAYLKVAHQLIADNLTINDGGQLYNERKPNTYSGFNPIDAKSIKFNMNIVNPEGNWNDNDNKTGWQFISSPFKYTQITSFTENLNGDYDLYKYTTKSVLWDNQKHENGIDPEFETEFVSGRGYLVSYEKDNNVTLTGTINTSRNIYILAEKYSNDNPLENIYLIGNPFTYDMGWKDIKESAWGISDTYVVVNDKGGYEYKQDGKIKVGDGCLILATTANASIDNPTFPFYTPETNESARNIENNSLNIIATSKAGKDNVVVNFANERGIFPKLKNLNDEIAEIYVTNEGKRYGAYNYNTDIKEIELNFDAKEMGSYTISFDLNGEFESVTLVDRFTGVETNMLLEGEYTFTATGNDNVNRFVIRLGNGQEPAANSQFVYQSGEELILSIEGSVQIVDMLGRVVYSNEHASGNNRIYVGEFKDASYVVRVINEEGVKVQKVFIY